MEFDSLYYKVIKTLSTSEQLKRNSLKLHIVN